MKKQRRGKFTYIPKDEIAEVTTFNDVTFENDDLLDGAYVKGRKKYARGGVMKAMSLDEQAAFAVGNDVWFSLPDIEKAELVEELVKSGMIVPTASDTDVRIMELIGQNEFADGGMTDNTKVITIGEDTWYLTYIDPTHFYLSNSPEFRGNAYHIGEFRSKEPKWLWNDVRSWLKSNGQKHYADGGMMADGGYTPNKFASMKGGISYFSVDIDTEIGRASCRERV
jgi:hypothetical protein